GRPRDQDSARRPGGPLADDDALLERPRPLDHRRVRLPAAPRRSRKPPLPSRQPPLRTRLDHPHHQPRHRLLGRDLRRHHRRDRHPRPAPPPRHRPSPGAGSADALRRVQLGQLRSLQIRDPLADAPTLEELFFVNKLDPDEAVVTRLASHPSLQTFSWWAPDEPIGKVRRIVETVGRPPATIERRETWLKRHLSPSEA